MQVLRQGARQLLATAIEAKVKEFMLQHNYPDTKTRFVRNYLPEREIPTGIGCVSVKVPRVRDSEHQIRFSSSMIPKYLRRSASMNEFLPLLYLKGISTNDFVDPLTPLVNNNAKNLSLV